MTMQKDENPATYMRRTAAHVTAAILIALACFQAALPGFLPRATTDPRQASSMNLVMAECLVRFDNATGAQSSSGAVTDWEFLGGKSLPAARTASSSPTRQAVRVAHLTFTVATTPPGQFSRTCVILLRYALIRALEG